MTPRDYFGILIAVYGAAMFGPVLRGALFTLAVVGWVMTFFGVGA